MPRTLLITDNEGCLTPGKGRAFDLEGLQALARALAANPEIKLTIATGRPASYVEALLQATGCMIDEPVICEGGAVLYFPSTDRTELLGEPADGPALMAELNGVAYRLEPGKQCCVSFYPEGNATTAEIARRLIEAGFGEKYTLLSSAAAVDVTPRGVDKAFGVDELRKRLLGSYDVFAGFGDSGNDGPLLRACDIAGCPSNATEEIRALSEFRSDHPHVWGLLAFIEHLS
ncbi:MAG TPA: HAD family hydrolase [Fimbriimonadaceae bacterium]|nr:HAD family hydrolase [Fimbriimonadaceae bacterium]